MAGDRVLIGKVFNENDGKNLIYWPKIFNWYMGHFKKFEIPDSAVFKLKTSSTSTHNGPVLKGSFLVWIEYTGFDNCANVILF